MHGKSRYTKASARLKRRSQFQNLFQLVVWFGLPLGFLVAILFLARADFFQIKNIEVVGNNVLSTDQLVASAFSGMEGSYLKLLPKTNYFFIKKDELASRLMKDWSQLENVEINKNLNGVLEIKVKERQGEFVWCSILSTDCYLMNNLGLAFDLLKPEELVNKVIFRNKLTEVNLLTHFTSEANFQNYLKVIDIFKNNQIEIYEITLDSSQKIIFKTNLGEIFLNPTEDLVSSANNAVVLINEVKTKTPTALFEYIDARFGNKVFYKLR